MFLLFGINVLLDVFYSTHCLLQPYSQPSPGLWAASPTILLLLFPMWHLDSGCWIGVTFLCGNKACLWSFTIRFSGEPFSFSPTFLYRPIYIYYAEEAGCVWDTMRAAVSFNTFQQPGRCLVMLECHRQTFVLCPMSALQSLVAWMSVCAQQSVCLDCRHTTIGAPSLLEPCLHNHLKLLCGVLRTIWFWLVFFQTVLWYFNQWLLMGFVVLAHIMQDLMFFFLIQHPFIIH